MQTGLQEPLFHGRSQLTLVMLNCKNQRSPRSVSFLGQEPTEHIHAPHLRNLAFPSNSRSNALSVLAIDEILAMNILGLCLAVQLCLAFGVAGLFWPDKLIPLFSVLLFPWAASYRSIRTNSIVALGLSLLLLARLLTSAR